MISRGKGKYRNTDNTSSGTTEKTLKEKMNKSPDVREHIET